MSAAVEAQPAQLQSSATAPPSAALVTTDLPKLSAADFRLFNRLAVHMNSFHNHFRSTWNTLYSTCTTGKRPAGMSLRQFLSLGLSFCHSLETHHTIEEHYVFPELAKKMPQFRQKDHLLAQHAQIHAGLDGFEKYLTECRTGERELRLDELKERMDVFGAVLWAHLDDEVEQLGAENMRKFWTKSEMERLGKW